MHDVVLLLFVRVIAALQLPSIQRHVFLQEAKYDEAATPESKCVSHNASSTLQESAHQRQRCGVAWRGVSGPSWPGPPQRLNQRRCVRACGASSIAVQQQSRAVGAICVQSYRAAQIIHTTSHPSHGAQSSAKRRRQATPRRAKPRS